MQAEPSTHHEETPAIPNAAGMKPSDSDPAEQPSERKEGSNGGADFGAPALAGDSSIEVGGVSESSPDAVFASGPRNGSAAASTAKLMAAFEVESDSEGPLPEIDSGESSEEDS